MKIGFMSLKGDFLVYPDNTTVDLREKKCWTFFKVINVVLIVELYRYFISDKLSFIEPLWLNYLVEVGIIIAASFITLTAIGNILVAINNRKHKKEENEFEENNI